MAPESEKAMELTDLKPSFYEMLLSDHLAERHPRSEHLDMAKCKKVAKAYLRKFPKSLPDAIAATSSFNLDKVVNKLTPPYLEWAKKSMPFLMEKPPGMY